MLEVYWPSSWPRETQMRDDLIAAGDPDLDPLTLAFVRDQHLRAADSTAENAYITRLMTVSLATAERVTRRPMLPQSRQLVLDRFPCLQIELPMAPLLTVPTITYVDADGAEQTLSSTASPAQFEVSTPTGPRAVRGHVRPLYGEIWPSVRYQPDAVKIAYTCGYEALGNPPVATIPEEITHGRLLVIGELYKQRSESVHVSNQSPALIRARDLFLAYRVY